MPYQLALGREATDEAIERWADSLTAEQVPGTFRYSNSKGQPREHAAWIAITHLFNHQAHHRGQVTTLLFQAGHDPGVTDFVHSALKPA